jgi:FkbM family methyltransferase
MKHIDKLLDIPLDKPVVLYGCGRGGVRFLKLLQTFRPGLEVICFIDSHKSGSVENLPVVSLNRFLENRSLRDSVTILATSLFWREIGTLLREQGIDDYLVVPRWFFYPPEYNRRLSETERGELKPQLDKVMSLLTHPEDRRLYRILAGDRTRFPSCFDAISDFHYGSTLNQQYFDFIRYEKISTMIDGGVFDGRNIPGFLKRMKKNGTIYGFEPNYKNYLHGKFQEELKGNPGVNILPLGLWSQSREIRLTDSRDASAVVEIDTMETGNTGLVSIDVVSIDDHVSTHKIKKVDFIKLDIEGAELEALKGAKHTLTHHRPQLAISIYHKKEDIYQIPLYLDDILEDYEYRLGHYTPGFCESIWYGMPR